MWKAALVLTLCVVVVFGIFLIFGGPALVWDNPRQAVAPSIMPIPRPTEPIRQFPPSMLVPAIEESPTPVVERGDFTVSGPFTHENLAVFFIHGADRLPGKDFLTLEEAVRTGQAVVHETRTENLDVENRSGTQELFVQAGDILRGGTQDRILRYDMIAAAGSGHISVPVFCVEQGRSGPRGDEDATCLTISRGCSFAPSKDLRLAARHECNQERVWAQVVATQDKLRRSLGTDLPTASASSLPLTVDAFAVSEAVEPYFRALSEAGKGKKEVIGFAFAVNGKLASAEVYASAALFAKLWPKMLRASAVEAVAERPSATGSTPGSVAAVRDFLADAEGGKARTTLMADRLTLVTQETNRGLLFETRDYYDGDTWVHRSYLTK
jgi:hypothetical protein